MAAKMKTLKEIPEEVANDVLMTTEQLALRWGGAIAKQMGEEGGISTGTLENWRGQRRGPKFVKMGASKGAPVFYKLSDIIEFENSMTVPVKGKR